MSETITISSDPIFCGTLSPLLYGEFMEPLNDLLPGMWAEKVQDRSGAGVLQPETDCMQQRRVNAPALGAHPHSGHVWKLCASGLDAVNSFVEKNRAAPEESTCEMTSGAFDYGFAPYSVSAITFEGM